MVYDVLFEDRRSLGFDPVPMAVDPRDCVEIPHPPALPLIGNIMALDRQAPLASIANMAKEHGPIFSLKMLTRTAVFISSHEYLGELCDEKRFRKVVQGALRELRNGVHDGLFTGESDEENWKMAHRTLVPAFGPLAISSMFDSMKDIASQLVLKWARHGSSYNIPVAEDFTRLTLDTLALCCMDYRFNSFYSNEQHPFVGAMIQFLTHAGVRARTPSYVRPFYRADEAKWWQNIDYMRSLARQVVQERMKSPQGAKDLLGSMVTGIDPKSGRGLDDESIIDNMITFLIAGHETTSGLLSFVFYYLLKYPEVYRKLRQEIDEVVGTDSVQLEHLTKLPYLTAVLRETARCMPTAPGFTVTPKNPQGEVIGGKYHVPYGVSVIAVLHNIHRDRSVYGEDADEFRPERMLGDNFDKLPSNAWKPFGNGMRGCIGRPFAWQEMLIVMPMLFQYFDFSLDDPSYDLSISFTLTIKPKNFFMRARLRPGYTATLVEQRLSSPMASRRASQDGSTKTAKTQHSADDVRRPITILYGSNSGTCEAFAQTLAADAATRGFAASKVANLDSAKQDLPTDEPVIIVTASYEGQPTDDATQFFHWLQDLKGDDRIKCVYAVFGCGHSDWKQTHHHVPLTIDQKLAEHGGQRLCDIGLADAAKGDMMSDFQTWEDTILWPALARNAGIESIDGGKQNPLSLGISVEVFNKRASQLRSDVLEAKVLAVHSLTAPGVNEEKRHLEFQLPSNTTYRAGDYCAVLPLNPSETVHRVMTRFGLPWDAVLKIDSAPGTVLPTDHPISARDLFGAYLELSQPATRRNVAMLVKASRDPQTRKTLQNTIDGDFNALIIDLRISLLDLLEQYPDIPLPLDAFIASLIPMRIRQYSISSSPLADATKAALTYSVLVGPSRGGHGRFLGAASNYLAHLQPGDIFHIAIRPSHPAFHLPSLEEQVPIVLVAAGAGLAPFRGFIQERAAQLSSSTSSDRRRHNLPPVHLYFGCRHPARDDLYQSELAAWEALGAVVVHRAYSQAAELTGGHRHIDAVLREDRVALAALWAEGAKVYVCGSRALGESVKLVCLAIAREQAVELGKDASDEALEAWLDGVRNDRYMTDVFD